jgi:ferredoxin
MALKIEANCTACDACVLECPNDAISEGEPIYIINALLCTECVGAEDEPQCQLECPVNDCIIKDPDWDESEEQLLEKYESLH